MTGPNKKLITAVEAYFTELHRVAGPMNVPTIRHWNTFLARSGMGSSPRCFVFRKARIRVPAIRTLPSTRQTKSKRASREQDSFRSEESWK